MGQVIRKGLIKRLHVDMHVIRANQKTGANDPALTVQLSSGPVKAHEVQINGPSKLIYRPEKPLGCGARCWIETQAEVELT